MGKAQESYDAYKHLDRPKPKREGHVHSIRIFPEVRHGGPHRNLGDGEVCVPCAHAAAKAKLRVNLGKVQEEEVK